MLSVHRLEVFVRVACLAILLLASSTILAATEPFDRLVDPETTPYRILGKGFITDSGHPLRPGHFVSTDVAVRVSIDPELGESVIEVEYGDLAKRSVDRYYVRRGRIFQVNDEGEETAPEREGDLSVATVAALHPAIVATAIRERRDCVRREGRRWSFAWNDELWSVAIDAGSGRVTSLERRVYRDVSGDDVETVTYRSGGAGAGPLSPGRVVVTSHGRETANLEFVAIERGDTTRAPSGDRQRDRAYVAAAREIEFTEVGPRLFAIELEASNSRIFVAEFADHLMVLEGAYNSRICDLVARRVRERFHKPVRSFAFSHLHGQYVGGVRSWVALGATVVVPPTTEPLIGEIVRARHDLRPDALSRSPVPLRVETVKDRRLFEDDTNALEVLNVPSEHTDEYFVFHFRRQKVLLTGDLLMYRPGKPLSGRSKRLCDTLSKLGLDVERFYATWPLDGYGTKNVVTAEEMRRACGESP